jgi:hypothetical protein
MVANGPKECEDSAGLPLGIRLFGLTRDRNLAGFPSLRSGRKKSLPQLFHDLVQRLA